MARGTVDAPAMEMTKWFDTNYHYIVPEFYENQQFSRQSTKVIDEFNEAKALGIITRPVIVGPVTFLSLGKAKSRGLDPLSLIRSIPPVYHQVLDQLAAVGAEWVQIDEPILACDLSPAQRAAPRTAYTELSASSLKIMLATYFGGLRDNRDLALGLPVAGLHIDLVRAPEQLDAVLSHLGEDRTLSIGVIDGRNVWRADLSRLAPAVQRAVTKLGSDRVEVAPSCSLLHSPVDLDQETKLDAELRSWLAFAKQKLAEVRTLATAADKGRYAVADIFIAADVAARSRAASGRIHNQSVKARAAALTDADYVRPRSFNVRREIQRAHIDLPLFPTTTIGSFPQTSEVRKARAAFRRGEIDAAAYEAFLAAETEKAVHKQEVLDLDVIVHGEFERNDMVEYFGELLDGFAFTQHGWVQSYGSRYVKPPLIFGDVLRPRPMTLKWTTYAQSLTTRPVKGMLTGPVTMLQWSFVRDDQPRSETCRQLALAIRDEVADLERAGIDIIQIDEPALREGLPLRKADRDSYLRWAVDCFRLATSGVADATQIHTHMCYSEFNDIMLSIAALDADVISIETSRSQMELLDAFAEFYYPNEIGPGVWDIHSPRIAGTAEMKALLTKAVEVINPEKLWVNPDRGLKTRGWAEVEPALTHMVEAARQMRAAYDDRMPEAAAAPAR